MVEAFDWGRRFIRTGLGGTGSVLDGIGVGVLF